MALERPDSEVRVANLALDKCKCLEIATLDDPVKRAKVVRRHFPLVRDALLRRMDWNFASTWCLPAADPDPSPGRFDNRFVLPHDCLAIRDVEELGVDEWEAERQIAGLAGASIETMVLTCDRIDPHVRYTARVETVVQWDPLFMNVFVSLLAHAIAPACARSTGEAKGFLAEAETLMIDLAKKADSKERARQQQARNLNSWLTARQGVRRGW